MNAFGLEFCFFVVLFSYLAVADLHCSEICLVAACGNLVP